MQNYHEALVWKIDLLLILFICWVTIFIFVYLWVQEVGLRLRRRRLLNVKGNIYKLISAGKKVTLPSQERLDLTTQQLLDVITNR